MILLPLLREALTVGVLLSATGVAVHPPGADGLHDDHHHVASTDPAKVRAWTNTKTGEVVRGNFLAARSVDGTVSVSIERDAAVGGGIVVFALANLAAADRAAAQRHIDEINSINQRLAHGQRLAHIAPAPTDNKDNSPPQAAIFNAFSPFVATRWDERWIYIESDGLPHSPLAALTPGIRPEDAKRTFIFSHPMMIGITAWQQQVPMPQSYRGGNAWQIPRTPQLADKPVSAKEQLFRGAIALAANGVPIFNPIKNDGRTDTFLAGELDEFGGHCGRADDYHYHVAPTHLQKYVGAGQPIALALDGFPIYGLFDPSATPNGPHADKCCPLGSTEPLDWMNGHHAPPTPAPDGAPAGGKGLYHYHASVTYPYVNGGMRGVVTIKEDQIDPQPRASSPRAALPPLRGATITGFGHTGRDDEQAWTLEYIIRGRPEQKYVVNYRLEDGRWIFDFVDPAGRTKTDVYDATRPERRPGAGAGGRRGEGGGRRGEGGGGGGDEGTGNDRGNGGRGSRNDSAPPPELPPPSDGNGTTDSPRALALSPWVTPVINAPRVSFHTFDSPAARTKVSYHLYTPAAYDRDPNRRFPVVYWLHGSGGGLPGIRALAARFDAAIEAGRAPPCLVVFVNGLPEGMYVDSKDGATPVESVIVKDLLPHVDATHRTVATREGRVLEGFSMGGYGAARLGFKFPALFGAVSMMGAGPMQEELVQPPRAGRQRAAEVLAKVFGGDQAYFRAASPRTLAQQNAVLIGAGVLVRQVIGGADETFANNAAFHEHMTRLKIPHEWIVLPGVGHDAPRVLDALGTSNWAFYRRAFDRVGAAPAQARTPPAAPAQPAAKTRDLMRLGSADVVNGRLSIECTCDSTAAPRHPVLSWSEPPEGTKALAVVMHTVARDGATHVYMLVANIPATARALGAGEASVGTWGHNTVNRELAFAPPCSQGPGDKTYTITLYALSAEVATADRKPLTRDALLAAIADTTVGTATLDVKYARANK